VIIVGGSEIIQIKTMILEFVFNMVLVFLAIMKYVAILIEGKIMMIELVTIVGLFLIIFCALIFMYLQIRALDEFVIELTDLISRTFKQYYKTENIEPQLINNGIDLVWNPNNEDISSKKGFVTVWFGDANVDTPLIDAKDADILCGEIIGVIEKHLQDRDLGET
jgi:hypothetical protein